MNGCILIAEILSHTVSHETIQPFIHLLEVLVVLFLSFSIQFIANLHSGRDV